jgi:hypothetical protein
MHHLKSSRLQCLRIMQAIMAPIDDDVVMRMDADDADADDADADDADRLAKSKGEWSTQATLPSYGVPSPCVGQEIIERDIAAAAEHEGC